LNTLNFKKDAQTIKELVLQQQLKNMLPLDIDSIDIIFCANNMIKMYNSYRFDASFKPN